MEALYAERGVTVSYESARRWANLFGPKIAVYLRKRRRRLATTWHLGEAYLKIDGRLVYLWRAVLVVGYCRTSRREAANARYWRIPLKNSAVQRCGSRQSRF